MKFSYDNLRMAELNGDRIGGWKGLSVFAVSKHNLSGKASGAYFVVYNDDNIIVRKNSDGHWYSFGKCSRDGQVVEWDKKRYNPFANAYCATGVEAAAAAATHAVCGKTEEECDGRAAAVAADGDLIGDVKLGIDVETMLKSAREMTIDSLLEGFNYGLDVAKG
jgi:hypothetical protein